MCLEGFIVKNWSLQKFVVIALTFIYLLLSFVACDNSAPKIKPKQSSAESANVAIDRCLKVKNEKVKINCLDVVSKIYTCKIH